MIINIFIIIIFRMYFDMFFTLKLLYTSNYQSSIKQMLGQNVTHFYVTRLGSCRLLTFYFDINISFPVIERSDSSEGKDTTSCHRQSDILSRE